MVHIQAVALSHGFLVVRDHFREQRAQLGSVRPGSPSN
jgi:hypothetical protein